MMTDEMPAADGHTHSTANLLAQGVALLRSQQIDMAEQAFRQVLLREPENVSALHHMALLARDSGQLQQALDWFDKALPHASNDANLHYNLALTLQQSGQLKAAVSAYRKCIGIRSDFAQAYNNLGIIYQELGQHEQANAMFSLALQHDADRTETYYNLSQSKTFAADAEEIQHMQRLLKKDSLSPQERAKLHFALGKIYDQLKQYDQAFRHYEQANLLSPAYFDGVAFRCFIDQLIDVFDEAFFQQRSQFGSSSQLPVFVVGMPRSGTTLVEQILASHPQVHGAGELGYINTINASLASLLKSASPLPEVLRELTLELSQAISKDYLDQLSTLDPQAQRIVDKAPLNFLHLGLIALLFPQAHIIHCLRDPLDTCLSCYFQNFNQQHAYAQSLEDVALFYQQYQRLMTHWQQVLPLTIYPVNYQNLVTQPNTAIPELIRACGLPWDARCMDFHQHTGSVQSASQWQVRQPLYTHSVQRWKAYTKHLAALKSLSL